MLRADDAIYLCNDDASKCMFISHIVDVHIRLYGRIIVHVVEVSKL